MTDLIVMEFKKTRRTFLYKLLPFILLAPIVLVIVIYKTTPQANWIDIIAKYSLFIQMISFSYIVIAGCYTVCREYKDNTLPYISVTQKSIKKVLFSKYVFLLLQIWGTQLFIFLVLTVASSLVDGFSLETLVTFLKAGVISSISFSGLTSAIIYIAVLRQKFISSSVIFLFLFILTFPFSYMGYGYVFPHLLPLILVAKFFGGGQYGDINYGVCMAILFVFFVLFFFLSIWRIGRR